MPNDSGKKLENLKETRESSRSWLISILKNTPKFPGIIRNPQEFLRIPINPHESVEPSKTFAEPR